MPSSTSEDLPAKQRPANEPPLAPAPVREPYDPTVHGKPTRRLPTPCPPPPPLDEETEGASHLMAIGRYGDC